MPKNIKPEKLRDGHENLRRTYSFTGETPCDCGCNCSSFTEPIEALKFLMYRMNDCGVGDAVAESYAHDIYKILKNLGEVE